MPGKDGTTEQAAKELAYIVRSFEASCKIEHPTTEERAFRVALMRRLGVGFNLRELRTMEVSASA